MNRHILGRNQLPLLGRRQRRARRLALVVMVVASVAVAVTAATVYRCVPENVRLVRPAAATTTTGRRGGCSARAIGTHAGNAHVVGRGVVSGHGAKDDTVRAGAMVALVEAAVQQDGELKDGRLGVLAGRGGQGVGLVGVGELGLANLLALLEQDEGMADGGVDLVTGEGGLVGGLGEGGGVVWYCQLVFKYIKRRVLVSLQMVCSAMLTVAGLVLLY